MSRRTNPNLNASLIREGRMIFQQLSHFFGDRQPRSTSYNDVLIAEAQAKAAKKSALKCSVCLADLGEKEPMDAITIANGDAVCFPHLRK